MNTLVLATANPFKVQELQPVLSAHGLFARPQTDFFHEEVHEDGLSFVENAIKKARFASEKTGMPAIADDSGLEVDALQGEPGIYSARYAEEGRGYTTDEENLDKLLKEMAHLNYAERNARYSCAVVYVEHARDPMPLIGVGHWYGQILKEKRTGQGIGYDDVFWVPELVKTVSELPFDRKYQLSHRTHALSSVITQLKQRGKS